MYTIQNTHGIILTYRVLNLPINIVSIDGQILSEDFDDLFQYKGRKYAIHIPIICQGFVIDYASGCRIFSLNFSQNETYHEVVDELVRGAIRRIDENKDFDFSIVPVINF